MMMFCKGFGDVLEVAQYTCQVLKVAVFGFIAHAPHSSLIWERDHPLVDRARGIYSAYAYRLSTSYPRTHPRIEVLRILECADPRIRKLYTQWLSAQCLGTRLTEKVIRAFDRHKAIIL